MPNNNQAPMTKATNSWVLVIGFWVLKFICNLFFEYWNLNPCFIIPKPN